VPQEVGKTLPCRQFWPEFVAIVEKITPDQRVWVLLDLMGRTARVAVQAEALQVV